MDHGLGIAFFQDRRNFRKFRHVDFTVCAVHDMANITKTLHESSPHKSGRTGDKDPHARRLPDSAGDSNDAL